MNDVDEAIEAYRARVVAEAELAEPDLDEIEDHLRALTTQLQCDGLAATAAVAEAARRLGDPRRVAREHARVRSPFGAKISRLRAWSAALLLGPPMAINAWQTAQYGFSRYTLELGFGLLMAIALAARISWARAVVLGGLAFFALPTLFAVALFGTSPIWLVWHLGTLAFVLPWRRGELSGAGWSLALQVWAYGAAALALSFQMTAEDGSTGVVPLLAFAGLVCAVLATLGGVLRARWGAVASALGVLALGGAFAELVPLQFKFDQPQLFQIYLLAMIGSGALALAVSARLGWRTARSALGTFAHVLR